MIRVSARAQEYFGRLLQQQGEDDYGIRVAVTSPGTPAASVALSFCDADDLDGNEARVVLEGFILHVDAASTAWLDDAEIDVTAQGRMRISAPGIRGEVPEEDADLAARVRYVIDSEINPQLASHDGRVQLVQIDPGNIAVLEFGGGCHGCGMVDVTLKQGVEKTLRKRLPKLQGVRDATEHSTGENPYYRSSHGGTSAMA